MAHDSLISEFQRRLEEARAQGPPAVNELFMEQLDPGDRDVLRLCAIPDEFDAEVVRVLVPEVSPWDAETSYRRLESLPVVSRTDHGLVLQDSLRLDLFVVWLSTTRRAEFQAASARLVEWFEQRKATARSEFERDAAERRRMYHLLAVSEARGLRAFEQLCRAARNQYRLSECATLVRLVHDYDPILSPPAAAVLAYHEGKLALDERDWDRAESIFKQLAANPHAARRLRIQAQIRLGAVMCERGERAEALVLYRAAEDMARNAPQDADLVARAQLELALALREVGELDAAATSFRASAHAAAALRLEGTTAAAKNGLGNLLLRLNQPRDAVVAFEESLQHIDPLRDAVGVAAVYNNLGAAHRLLANWPAAERWYRRGLEMKRAAGDLAGVGTALTNLGQILFQRGDITGALDMTSEAVTLFERAGDRRRAAVAKWNSAKYHVKAGEAAAARALYGEAAQLFADVRDDVSRGMVLADASTLVAKNSIPWWTWLSLVLLALGVAVAIIAIVAEGH